MSEIVTHEMERAALDGLELEYELRGSGEPVVLIHWGLSAAWGEPLMEEPALADHCRLLSYHRAGFAGSDRIEGPLSLGDHAAHCARLMRHLGIERAHLVGPPRAPTSPCSSRSTIRTPCTRSRSWSRRARSRRPTDRGSSCAIS